MFLYASSNRDEREFWDPDTFNIDCPNERILSVGAGIMRRIGHISWILTQWPSMGVL